MELLEGIRVVAELPVIYLPDINYIVLADTHLGFEEEMAGSGVFVPRFQLRKLMDILETVFSEISPKGVIIAGDFKHQFSGLGRVERRELSIALSYLNSKVDEVVVVRGNHDNYLPLLRRKHEFELTEEVRVGRYLIVHGHKELPEVTNKDVGWSILVFAHEHPSITLRDTLGVVGKFPCFLTGKLPNGREFITLPAVGAYQTGSKVTLDPSTYLSPILKKVDLTTVRPFVVDEDVGIFELPQLGELLDFM